MVSYQDHIKQRTIDEAVHIINTGSTVRETARKFLVSKSTVYNDVTMRLKNINKELYHSVSLVLQVNKSESTIRGGLATKEMYRSRVING